MIASSVRISFEKHALIWIRKQVGAALTVEGLTTTECPEGVIECRRAQRREARSCRP